MTSKVSAPQISDEWVISGGSNVFRDYSDICIILNKSVYGADINMAIDLWVEISTNINDDKRFLAVSIAALGMTKRFAMKQHISRISSTMNLIFPSGLINGRDKISDDINSGLVHIICAMMMHNASLSGIDLAQKAIIKRGDAVIGSGFTDTEAGRIGRELYDKKFKGFDLDKIHAHQKSMAAAVKAFSNVTKSAKP